MYPPGGNIPVVMFRHTRVSVLPSMKLYSAIEYMYPMTLERIEIMEGKSENRVKKPSRLIST